MSDHKATNITWHKSGLSKEDRAKHNGHMGAVLWFTGLSGSGKSTLACALEKRLFDRGCYTYILDGDNIRYGLSKDLGFSSNDREENIRRIGEVAHLFADAGLFCLTAFISPYQNGRMMARNLSKHGAFIEILCDCSLDICEQRDPKGLYEKVRAGEIKNFTGIDAPYEKPTHPEIVVNTGENSVDKCVDQIIDYLEDKKLFVLGVPL